MGALHVLSELKGGFKPTYTLVALVLMLARVVIFQNMRAEIGRMAVESAAMRAGMAGNFAMHDPHVNVEHSLGEKLVTTFFTGEFRTGWHVFLVDA